MSLVSVIIPNYNGAKWISKTLNSCIIQKKYLKEIIIVDDNSEDDSWSILEKIKIRYPSIIKLYKNPIKGANNARNYGFTKATGKYIQWLDVDDQLIKEKFEKQIDVFNSNKNVDIVYSDHYIDRYSKENVLLSRDERIAKREKYYLLELLEDNWISTCSYLLSYKAAKIGENIKAWNPERKAHQDTEYYILLALQGLKFKYAPGLLCIYNKWNTISISNLNFGLKTHIQFTLLEEVRSILRQTDKISVNIKQEAIRIINTRLLYLTLFNRRNTISEKFPITDLKPDVIKTRARYFVLLLYLWQHLLLVLKTNMYKLKKRL